MNESTQSQSEEQEEWVTIADVMRIAGVSRGTVRSWGLAGKVRRYKIGRAVRISAFDVRRVMTEKLPPVREVLEMYMSGMTLVAIAATVGPSAPTVAKILKTAGVTIRPIHAQGGPLNRQWKGGRSPRKDGYVTVWTPEGPRLEHRVVMARHIGRKLLCTEVVHHIDGNRSNNHVDNLEIMSQSQHSTKHGAEIRQRLQGNGMKECTLCRTTKALAAFHRGYKGGDMVQSWCKACRSIRDREYKARRRSRGNLV